MSELDNQNPIQEDVKESKSKRSKKDSHKKTTRSKKGEEPVILLDDEPNNNNDSSNFISSKHPDLIPPAAQIAFPTPPNFENLDVPEVALHDFAELSLIKEISELISKSNSFISFFYTYRSISKSMNRDPLKLVDRAINIKNEEALDQHGELKKKILTLFTTLFLPTYNRIMDFYRFSTDIVDILKRIIYKVIELPHPPSVVFFSKLSELFSSLFNVDKLKMRKVGVNNDFSFLKRNPDFMDTHKDEIGYCGFFLATPFDSFQKMNLHVNKTKIKLLEFETSLQII